MQYRLATEPDFEQLARLRWDYVDEMEELTEWDQDVFIRHFCTFLQAQIGSRYVCWVAEEAGKIVSNVFIGVIEKVPKPFSSGNLIGYVTNVYTHPDYRNQGIGSELMDRVQDWAKTHAFEVLFVRPTEPSIPFYERHAFAEADALMAYFSRSL